MREPGRHRNTGKAEKKGVKERSSAGPRRAVREWR